MDTYRIFIDFGSTFTKVVAFQMEEEVLAARVQAPSTVDTDVTLGLQAAIDLLKQEIPVTSREIDHAKACSSAAGGLRMACVGFVPEFTTAAGRMAALGAGARVVGTYSYELSRQEIQKLEGSAPDIVLLCGGTDGGNQRTICRNAELLAAAGPEICHIIVAGNKSARPALEDIFLNSSKSVLFTDNVMPEFGRLDLEPVNREIRTLFLRRITQAKGIATVSGRTGAVLMPTPSAVLRAAELLSQGAGNERGFGDLLLVDVGGATTDVCSIGTGYPTKEGASMVGLPEPFAKRTVEGDLGLFHNLDALAEIAALSSNLDDAQKQAFQQQVDALHAARSIPSSSDQSEYQSMLTGVAIKTAVDRHAGKLEQVFTRNGEAWIQRGKDLSAFKTVVGVGGPVAFSKHPAQLLQSAVYDPQRPYILKPRTPSFFIDQRYILFACGLLSADEPEKAIRIMRKYLPQVQK